jgi:hypothetical protein
LDQGQREQVKLMLIRPHHVVYCRRPWLHLGKGQ